MDTVNWLKLGEAVNWYKAVGYRYTEVPWIVSDGPYNFTKPPGAPAYFTLGGNLVASGEQSFMEMLQKGEKLGKMVCCTPCFRREPTYDKIHLPHFMKVELIHVSGGREQLLSMMKDSYNFFQNHYQIPCGVLDIGDGSYDLIGTNTGIELGSYGIRKWEGFSWVYGTGLAEPRASQVYELERDYNRAP